MKGLLAAALTATLLACALPAAAESIPPGAILPTVDPATARARQWWLPLMRVGEVHAEGNRGKGVKVCLIDSGVNPEAPSIKGIRFESGANLALNGSPDGLRPLGGLLGYHGTQMTALIAGQGEGPGNSQGILGIAPEATIVSVSLDEDNNRSLAFRYCVDHGANLINLSETGSPVDQDTADYLAQHQTVLVQGTGNVGVARPGTFPLGRVGVSGINQDLSLDPNSTYGSAANTDEGFKGGVALAGPYRDSPDKGMVMVNDPLFNRTARYTQTSGGTSAATAVVTGAFALVKAAHPDLDAANLINRVISTARPIGDGPVPSAKFGWGVPDVYRAIHDDVPPVSRNPLGSMPDDRAAWVPGYVGNKPAQPAPPSAGSPANGSRQWAPWLLVGLGVAGLSGLGGVLVLSLRRRKHPIPPEIY